MNRILTALSYMILLALVAGVLGGGYLAYLAIGATIAAVPSVAWLATGGAVLFAGVLLVVAMMCPMVFVAALTWRRSEEW